MQIEVKFIQYYMTSCLVAQPQTLGACHTVKAPILTYYIKKHFITDLQNCITISEYTHNSSFIISCLQKHQSFRQTTEAMYDKCTTSKFVHRY